jgi:hypothetical protein
MIGSGQPKGSLKGSLVVKRDQKGAPFTTPTLPGDPNGLGRSPFRGLAFSHPVSSSGQEALSKTHAAGGSANRARS